MGIKTAVDIKTDPPLSTDFYLTLNIIRASVGTGNCDIDATKDITIPSGRKLRVFEVVFTEGYAGADVAASTSTYQTPITPTIQLRVNGVNNPTLPADATSSVGIRLLVSGTSNFSSTIYKKWFGMLVARCQWV
jgi:hypothetical protein